METLRELVESLKHNDGDAISWTHKDADRKDVRSSKSFTELYEEIQQYSRAFLSLSLSKGDKVAYIADNNPDWISVTLGLNNAGLIDVPRGTDTARDELAYILEHSDSRVAVVDDEKTLDVVKDVKKDIPELEHIIDLSSRPDLDPAKDYHTDDHIIGREQFFRNKKKDIILPKILPEDTSSIIYTSGTTGRPKGVELTHKNLASNIGGSQDLLEVVESDKFISILPAWHAFERMAKYVALNGGAETFYSNPGRILKDLEKETPTIMPSVPRVWKSVYSSAQKKLKKQIESSNLVKIVSRLFPFLITKKVEKSLKSVLGENFNYAISGGGALPDYIDKFFAKVGVEILEGYGLTETSPIISGRKPGSFALGTVGPPIKDVEVDIRDTDTGKTLGKDQKGLIYVSGPNVMKGYYKDQEETEKTISYDDSGKKWLYTGDIGYIDKKGNITISGRAKEMIVLLGGENINPRTLEDAIEKSPYISDAFVTAEDDWKMPGALIVPEYEELEEYCAKNDISYDSSRPEKILDNPEINNLFDSEIGKYVNKDRFKPTEIIRKYHILPKPFEVGKHLTQTLKYKRNEIMDSYKKDIQALKRAIHDKL